MGNELTIINNSTTLQEGGLGIDTTNKLFQLKPATLSIVQPQSTIEGANKGSFRINETGDQFNELECSLLVMPKEMRNYHIGEPGELNRTPENLMCFSTDMVQPHAKAKSPQAALCAHCSRSDWKPYQEYKEKYGKVNKQLIPRCDPQYIVYMIDTIYQLPLRMYIRGTARDTFEKGMDNVSRVIHMARAQKKNPNLFDVKFKITTKLIQNGSYKYYVPIFSDAKLATEDEKLAFGAMYLAFIEQQNQKQVTANETKEIAAVQNTVDTAVEGEYIEGNDNEVSF